MLEAIGLGLVMSFSFATVAACAAIVPSRMNPWSPFVVMQGILIWLTVLQFGEFGVLPSVGRRFVVLGTLAVVLLVWVALWRREDLRRAREQSEHTRRSIERVMAERARGDQPRRRP